MGLWHRGEAHLKPADDLVPFPLVCQLCKPLRSERFTLLLPIVVAKSPLHSLIPALGDLSVTACWQKLTDLPHAQRGIPLPTRGIILAFVGGLAAGAPARQAKEIR
jgi:hypothetical protein